jgi:hypothetical protein
MRGSFPSARLLNAHNLSSVYAPLLEGLRSGCACSYREGLAALEPFLLKKGTYAMWESLLVIVYRTAFLRAYSISLVSRVNFDRRIASVLTDLVSSVIDYQEAPAEFPPMFSWRRCVLRTKTVVYSWPKPSATLQCSLTRSVPVDFLFSFSAILPSSAYISVTFSLQGFIKAYVAKSQKTAVLSNVAPFPKIGTIAVA